MILSGWALAFCTLPVLLFVNCAPKPKLLPEARTPENVLRCALDNQPAFETLACLVKMKMKGPEAGFSGTIEFFYKEPDIFAFYPRTLFGIGGFEATGREDSLTVYFPRRNEYFRGSFSDFDETSPWKWDVPLHLLLDLILGRSGLSDGRARYAGREGDAFLFELEDGSWHKSYWVDSPRCRLTKSRWVGEKEREVLEVEYGGFKREGPAEIPGVIIIRSHPSYSARLKFVERKVDKPLPDALFDLQIPSDAVQVSFESSKSD